MYGNGRPVGTRTRIRLLIAVVLLAWATQTLLRQWGYGAEIAAPEAPVERFVAGSHLGAGATLELRGEATITGGQVKLKQVCRWSDSDAATFASVADLIVARVSDNSPFRAISLDEIRSTLHDAGLNLGLIRFVGPVSCTISRSDAEFDPEKALWQWANAAHAEDGAAKVSEETETREGNDTQTSDKRQGLQTEHGTKRRENVNMGMGEAVLSSAPLPASERLGAGASSNESESPVRSLRALLTRDLAVRLGIPEDQLQITFNPQDEKLLSFSGPLFKFNIEPRRARNLGEVAWEVLVVGAAGSHKSSVMARARAWQKQVVVAKPLAYHQVIQAEDVMERRLLAEQLPDEPLLAMDQVIGQEAARDLRDGTVLTARTIDAVPLVKSGQLVTITLQVGSVQVKSVGRAMEAGSYGQAIRVRNDTTRDVFEVVMTAPQQGTMGPLPMSAKLGR